MIIYYMRVVHYSSRDDIFIIFTYQLFLPPPVPFRKGLHMVYMKNRSLFTFESRCYCGSNNHLLFIIQIRKSVPFSLLLSISSAHPLGIFLFDPMSV